MNSIVIETKSLPTVVHNLEDIKADLVALKERYETAIYDESTISIAKKERAMLNNVVKDLDEKRKSVKNTYLEPYNQFDKEIKALEGIIRPAIENIDKQVKEFEEAEKTLKKAEISEYFTSKIGNLNGFIALDKIWNDKWFNKGMSMESIMAEIDMSIEKINMDIMSIEDLGSENEAQLKAIFFRNLDLSSAISENARLKRETARVEQNITACAPKASGIIKKIVIEQGKPQEPAQNYVIGFTATKRQFSEVHALLFSLGISWKDKIGLDF